MKTNFEAGEPAKSVVHGGRRKFRGGEKNFALDDAEGKHAPLPHRVRGQGSCDSRRNAGGIHFRNRKPLLKTERSVKAVLVDEALAEKILAQSDLLRLRGERRVENRRVE